jgi:hypothetical protein
MVYPENPREYETLTLSHVDLPANPVGDLVWEFARSNLGNSFPRGQCTDFVIAALKAAGAQPGDISVYPYVWGEEIPGPPQWGTWLQGYIVQFTKAQFKWTEGGTPHAWGTADQHTAIIMRPPLVCVATPPWPTIAGNPDAWAVWLIHQNDNDDTGAPRLFVTQREVYLNAKVSGDFIVYRPVLPPPPHGRLR